MDVPEGISKSVTLLGTPVVIYTFSAGGDRPIHGAYFSGEAWFMCAWTNLGRVNPGHTSPLDIVISPKTE